MEKQTPIIENDYMPDEDYELDNKNKKREDAVEQFKDSPSLTGKKINAKNHGKK